MCEAEMLLLSSSPNLKFNTNRGDTGPWGTHILQTRLSESHWHRVVVDSLNTLTF